MFWMYLGHFTLLLQSFGDQPLDRIPLQLAIFLYVTLQSDKKLKIFKKCITSLRFVDRLLLVDIRFSAIAYTFNFNNHNLTSQIKVGTSWISDYLKSSKHRGNRWDRS
jgi:hypothetical protein